MVMKKRSCTPFDIRSHGWTRLLGDKVAIQALGNNLEFTLFVCFTMVLSFQKKGGKHREELIRDGSVVEGTKIFQSREHGFRLIVQNKSLAGNQSIGPVTVEKLKRFVKIGGRALEGLLLITCAPHGSTFDEPLLLDFEVDRGEEDVVDEFGLKYVVRVSIRLPWVVGGRRRG